MRTLLSTVDGSRASWDGFKQALVLASKMRARLVLVSVTPKYEGNMNRMKLNDASRQLNQPFLAALEEAKQYAASVDFPLETIHRVGEPAQEILDVALQSEATLLVIGCAHRSQLERMLLGRTSARILAGSPCDVLFIPEGGQIRLGEILVELNSGPNNRLGSERALQLGLSYGSRIHGLFAVDVPLDKQLRYGVEKDARQKGFRVIESFSARGDELGLAPIALMKEGSPENVLVKYAGEKNIDLIVLSAPEESGVDLLRGNLAERVVALASCPVLVVTGDGEEGL